MIPSSDSPDSRTMVRYSRCTPPSVVPSTSSVSPMMPLSGVRISWLMLARKVLLMRLADSAASFAACSCASARRRWRSVRSSERAVIQINAESSTMIETTNSASPDCASNQPQACARLASQPRSGGSTSAAGSSRRAMVPPAPRLTSRAATPPSGCRPRTPPLRAQKHSAVFSAMGKNGPTPYSPARL